jgi:hypothetical protein
MTHKIVEKLKAERIRQGLSRVGLSEKSFIHRNTIRHHEESKFSALSALDRWATALGYRLELVSAETTKSGEEET